MAQKSWIDRICGCRPHADRGYRSLKLRDQLSTYSTFLLMTLEAAINGTCPLCANALTFKFSTDEIPFFGEIMLVSTNCTCGFKYADTITLNEREAARYEICLLYTSPSP